MVGNASEWTSDCWEDDCSRRVLRGGTWYNSAQYLRPGRRTYGGTDFRGFGSGFRVSSVRVGNGRRCGRGRTAVGDGDSWRHPGFPQTDAKRVVLR